MAKNEEDDDFDFAVDSVDPTPREDGRSGPPDDWPYASWYDRTENNWYWLGKPDPCPIKFMGFAAGKYYVISGALEWREFTSSQLHGRGGLADLFGGSLWWPLKHFRKYDPEKKQNVGKLQQPRLMSAIIRACIAAGPYNGAIPVRGVGTWRGPDGKPIVHAGERIFAGDGEGGEIHAPGSRIGDPLYVIGADRQAPAYENVDRHGYVWRPAAAEVGRRVAGHLDEWHWQDAEARDLFQGGLHCDMLGDALAWKPHKFVRARAGSGKSVLLRYARALLGGSAHPIQRSFSKTYLEAHFAHTACALLLEEAESTTDPNRIAQVFDLVLLLSDEGATGGRYNRNIDLHGLVTMVATLTDDWKTTVRSRMAFLELRKLRDRAHPMMSEAELEGMIGQAAELSPALRARAIATFDLFQENRARARERILQLGGDARDGAQYGHLIAGWWTMQSDEPMPDKVVEELERFAPYILTIADAVDGEDDASLLYNVLLGLPCDSWRGGERLTIGQLIARARDPDNVDMRRALLPYGLQLKKLERESWPEAWLVIANKHPGLDKLFTDYPHYKGNKRAQILSDLARTIGGVPHKVQPTPAPLRFAGSQSRGWMVPPALLPTKLDEDQATGAAAAPRSDDEV